MSEDALELQMLIHAAMRGDEAAFEQLVIRYQADVYRCAFALVGNRADAEDVTQEVFLKLWQTLPRYRFAASFRTYLTRITQNAARDLLRRERRHRRMLTPLYVTDETGEHPLPIADPDAQADPLQGLLSRERRQLLLDAIEALPTPLREVLVLRAQAGCSYDEIARTLSVPCGSVKSRLHRAKAQLLTELEQRGFFS